MNRDGLRSAGKQKTITPSTSSASAVRTPTNTTKQTTPTSVLKSINSDMDKLVQRKIDDLLNRLTKDLQDLRTDFLKQLTTIENNLFALITEANTSVDALKDRVKILESRLESESLTIVNDEDLQKRCDVYERREVSSDAVLLGIPELHNENITSIYNYICNAIECTPPPLNAAFRIKMRNKNSLHNSPIVLKFGAPHERNMVLKCIANFHKNNQRQLKLEDIGFKVQAKKNDDDDTSQRNNIYLQASLTPRNRSYFKQAMRLKQNGLLFSVFTRSGSIFVKEREDSDSLLINNNAIMKALADKATTTNHDEEAHH